MIRVILCISFLYVYLDWHISGSGLISAETTTLTQETSKDSTIIPNNNEVTKNVTKEEHDINLSRSSTDKTETLKGESENQDEINKTDSSENRSRKSLGDPSIRTPYVSESLSLEQDEDEEDEDTNGPVNKHESTDRDDPDKQSPNSRSTTQPPQEDKEKGTSYMGKITSNLLMPVLKTQNHFGKALHHTNEAIKNIGSGTYEAASGAFSFFKDTASAVIRNG